MDEPAAVCLGERGREYVDRAGVLDTVCVGAATGSGSILRTDKLAESRVSARGLECADEWEVFVNRWHRRPLRSA